MALFLDRRLLVVVGKGGVGKSTVAAALALAGARAGKRVLVCEVNTRERVSALLDARPVGPKIGQVAEGIDAVNVSPQEAMREYALMVLKFRSIYSAVFENRLVRYFLRAVPSLAELVMLGKILFHVEETLPDGRFRYDLVVVDAPSTGHALTFLQLPQVLLATVPKGPMADEVRWMEQTLMDKRKSAAVLVTLPESMPVDETIELNRSLRDRLEMPRAALIINAVVEPRFCAQERQRLREAPLDLAGAAEAVLSRERRAEMGEHYARKLAVDVDLPQVAVPYLFTRRFGRAEVAQVSRILEDA